ncbi:unnamed protein product [Arctia plantaginis]|uniref:Aminopeptidase N n=1 Tax=Arctia plantaginis TaxID=874455 RepID=A0A8S1BKX7_ARCPL|nr:unnamed protein product [Arctia plantaginis]
MGNQRLSWFNEIDDESINEIPDARNDNSVYRLPENVIPLKYDIFIDLYFNERTDRPFSYDGQEYILIQAVQSNVTQIVLHANVDTINSVTLLNEDNVEVALNPLNRFEIEPLYHFLKINPVETLRTGTNYTLYISYTSTMNEGPMNRGIWRGWYKDSGGVERVYATTHFQPYNARQAFPCWDEPLFKAIFKLHLSKPASFSGTFTNTRLERSITLANGRVRDDYLETPKMSSYLVTFLVSETFQPIAQDLSRNPPIRIIGRSNTVGLGGHALNLAVKLTDFFDEYFGIPYSTLHPNLLNDHVSSPDWASAGTENWGMVSYRELHMIVDPNVALMSVEHYSATLVSHELAHKWFGNYITCYWWSNTWINEGYASYFGYIATHQVFPEYELHDHFNSRYLQTSLAFDSGTGTVPLNHDVNTPAQVTGHFGTISYSKAAAFVRMTANIISLETFRKSCRIFLLNNPLRATDQYDLLRAFTEAIQEDNSLAAYPNFNFTEYYRIWVNEPGYPLLNVDVNHSTGEITLNQERFFLSTSAAATGQVYPIPITFSTRRNANFNNLTPSHMMTTASYTLRKDQGEEWVIFNNLQQGHYRVNYDNKTWDIIADTLYNTPEEIHYLNRAQIVDDVFALMRSTRMTYNAGFKILRFLASEINFHVWDPAISGYTWLRNRLRHLPEHLAEFDVYLLNQMDYAVRTLGPEPAAGETPTTTMARQSILHFACTIGHIRCTEESWRQWVNWRDNNVAVNSRVRRNVYTTAMRQGDSRDFEYLLNALNQTNFANEYLEILRGLGAIRQPELLNRYLSLTLTQSVRSHDKLNSFNFALLGHRDNARTVLQFVKNNINQIRTAYVENSPPSPVHSALSNLASYLDEPELVDYENWLRSSQSNIPQFASAISAINSARSNMNWGTQNADMIISATEGSSASTAVSSLVLITMALNSAMHIISLTCLALVALARADFPVDVKAPVANVRNDDAVYRVPEDIDPIHYVVEITPYFEAEGNKEAFTFDGIVTLTFTATQSNLNSFVIQENVREIVSVSLTTASGVPVTVASYDRIREYHFLRVNLAAGNTLVNGASYQLTVVYVGNINETPLSRGVFRGNYIGDDGRVHWYAATHLQPTHSRQAFPSLDEPGFKSTFDIIINRPANYGETYANMHLVSSTPNGNRVREVFQRTPRMSAYLISFHISEDFTVLADNKDIVRPYRILGRPNARGQGEYALEVGPPLTTWLSNYFNIDYYNMEPNIKNDQIASPYWASGATENWGLVTYRELRLLYEEGETNAVDKLSIGTITAHELAHKWFGNLITCRWWDNVWINEGFASYFEYFAMDGVDKSLELEDQFNIMYLQSALSSDQTTSTRALQHTVNSPTQVTGHFTGISYTKGASLLLMLKHLVSEDTFKKALNYFLLDRAYREAFPVDLYNAFRRAVSEDGLTNVEIGTFMQTWVDEVGYPVLTVNTNMETGDLTLTQERFFISASVNTTQQIWPLPLTYTTGSSPNWDNLQASQVMGTRSTTLTKTSGEEWVIFNLQQKNMYRVNYDSHNWQLIANALSENFSSIHHLNRAQIVDDVFALMRSRRMTYELGFQVLQFLKRDTSFYSWYPAITGFNWLRNRFLHLPEVSAEFDKIIVDFMDNTVEHLGYDVDETENLSTTLNRFYLLTFACNVGHEGCISDSQTKFRALVANGTPVNPNLRRHVYCIGLRSGDMGDFNSILNLYRRSNNQAAELVLLRALGCTTNQQAGVQYLDLILSTQIKAQDKMNAFSFYYIGHRDNAKNALEWLKSNIVAVRTNLTPPLSFSTFLSTLISYLDEEGLQNMETWLNANTALVPEYNVGLSAINSVRANMQWGDENAQIVLEAARGSAAILLPTTMVIMTALLSMLLK